MGTELSKDMNKIIIVTRKTRLVELIHKYNTIEQAKFYIEHMGVDFSDYITEDVNYNRAVQAVRAYASEYARVQEIDREFIPNMIFGKTDIVIAVGQDGLVANVMKYLDGQYLVGVNPDENRWDGVLLPFVPRELPKLLSHLVNGEADYSSITMAEAITQDGQHMLAVNDLFIGCRTHASARYEISYKEQREVQSSSGIIVSTGLGSTGWYKSVVNQASRMAELFGGQAVENRPLSWEDEELTFVVREAFPSRATQADLVYGLIEPTDEFRVLSQMATNGVVFSDGMEDDAITFNSGMTVTIKRAEKTGCLVTA